MSTSRRIVTKGERKFARIHWRGGEYSFPLGTDEDGARALYPRIQVALANGRHPDQIRRALRDGRDVLAPDPMPEPSRDLTVAEAVSKWLSERIDLELSTRYAADVRGRAERALLPFLGTRPLNSLRRPDCHAYLSHLRKTLPDLEPSTLGHYLRGLREFLNWAEEVELLTTNPWPPRRIMPSTVQAPPDRLTDDEVTTLVNLPAPWGFSMRLALQTGCRWGELVRLERKDLTTDGQLLIRKAKDKEPRTVPIPMALLREIVAHSGRLFVTRHGTPYSEKATAGFNATVQRRSGIDRFHVHMTRHTYACRFLEAGGELVALQQILGHSTIRMTQKYGRPGEKAVRADAARVFTTWATREETRESDSDAAVATSL